MCVYMCGDKNVPATIHKEERDDKQPLTMHKEAQMNRHNLAKQLKMGKVLW